MEFKSLRNIESSFRQIRLFGIVFLSLCDVVTVWSVWNSYRFAEKQREKIYVSGDDAVVVPLLGEVRIIVVHALVCQQQGTFYVVFNRAFFR